MTKYRTIDVNLEYRDKNILAHGKIEKKGTNEWELLQDFSTTVNLDGDIAEQVLLVVRSIAEKDYIVNQILVMAKKIIETKEIEFKQVTEIEEVEIAKVKKTAKKFLTKKSAELKKIETEVIKKDVDKKH